MPLIPHRKNILLQVPTFASDFDFDFDAAREFQFHQRIDGLGGRAVDVHQSLVGVELELFARFLVHKGGTVYREHPRVRGQRNGTADTRTGGLDRLDDFLG